MSDRPWLEVSDPALRAERELLKRLSSEEPPSGSVEQGWAALSAEIVGLQALSSAGSTTADAAHSAAHASTGGSFAFAAKVVASVAVAGGTVWGGSQLLATSDSARVQPPAARPAPQVAPAPRAVAPLPPLSSSATDESVAKPAPLSNAPRPAASTTSLAEEGRLLAKARQLVLSGQGRQALEVLRLSESRYPRSVLSPEREVITIEALAATGATGSAKQRSERFLKRYPASPHAGRLQRFVE
jgi:hypothetical protein